MNKTELTPFEWGVISLSEVVYIDGVPHATRQAIGEWLEYPRPSQAMRDLLSRNPHIEEHSTVRKLRTVDGKNREVNVYHPIGFLLIVMESGQPKAKKLKQAVAEFVWQFAGPKPLGFGEHYRLRNQQLAILRMLARTENPPIRAMLLDTLREVCLLLGQPVPPALVAGH